MVFVCWTQDMIATHIYTTLVEHIGNDLTQLLIPPTHVWDDADFRPQRRDFASASTSIHSGTDNPDALVSSVTYGRLIRHALVRMLWCCLGSGSL